MPDAPTAITTIEGEQIVLGPLSRDLLPTITRWMNDLGAQQRVGIGIPGPVTLDGEIRWYDGVIANTRGVTFVIRRKATSEPLGTCALDDIDYRNRCATFGIMVGDASQRGKGYGTEAARLMLDYAFTVLGLHSVHLTVAGYNLAGQKAYARAGFRECGRLRECRWMAGKLYDEVHMDCLAHEFQGSVIANRFQPD